MKKYHNAEVSGTFELHGENFQFRRLPSWPMHLHMTSSTETRAVGTATPTFARRATDRPQGALAGDPLRSTTVLAPDRLEDQPVFVVGLPRSGSSYLAHLLQEIDGLYVFDDYYALQKAEAIALDRGLDDAELERFVDRLAWETRARVKFEEDFRRPDLELGDVDEAEQAILATFEGVEPMWHDVAAEWLVRLARHHGSDQWGWKTPQDFLHLDRLIRIWPNARIIHLARDPRAIMTSLKNLTWFHGSDGDPRQYHPIAYSLYWRMSERVTADFVARSDADLLRVRFETLRDDPATVAAEMAEFCGRSVGRVERPQTVNSTSGAKGRRLTPTELWIVQRLAGAEMASAGYDLQLARPRLRDALEIGRVSAGFAGYQVGRVVSDPEKRASVRRVVAGSLGRR